MTASRVVAPQGELGKHVRQDRPKCKAQHAARDARQHPPPVGRGGARPAIGRHPLRYRALPHQTAHQFRLSGVGKLDYPGRVPRGCPACNQPPSLTSIPPRPGFPPCCRGMNCFSIMWIFLLSAYSAFFCSTNKTPYSGSSIPSIGLTETSVRFRSRTLLNIPCNSPWSRKEPLSVVLPLASC